MALAPVRIAMTAEAKRGDIVEIKALMRHPMETGYRVDDRGQPIPRDIVKDFTVTYGGEEVFRWELNPGISANPYVVLSVVATETAELVFTWTDQKGTATTEKKQLTVTG